MRVPRPLPALLALLLATACTGSSPAREAPPAPGTLSWSPCERGFDCSTLTVPLDGADPAAGTLDLALTRRPATGDRVGSLVVNPGGPGVSAVDSLQQTASGLPAALRERFDLVAYDPRGVGRSAAVRCGTTQDLDRFWALDPSPDDPAEVAALEQGSAALVRGCAERSGRVLPHVSTVAAAADLERLRAALGEERLTYLGYSYGTAIGAAYLQAHPQRVRAMVLDGALDPALTWEGVLEGQSRGFDTALQALLDDCARRSCALREAAEGDPAAAFDALAARVEREPLPAGDGRAVGPGELTLAVGVGLYDRRQGWPAVTAALADGVRGDGRALLALSDAYLERDEDGYASTAESNLAVNCVDRPWPRTTQPYLDLAARLEAAAPRFGPAIALSGLPCATWPVPPAAQPAPVSAEGAPPVVVVGTTRDPATPYAWSVALAGQLASGVLVTHEGDGHTVYSGSGPRCITAPLDAYLVEARAPGPFTC